MATSKMKLSRRNGMKAIGIDLGTTYTCFGIWRSDHDRVEIMTNEQGNRTTPSMVAFTAAERLVGQAAMNQLARNHQNTVFDAKRIIGRRFSDPSIQTDNAIWPFSVIADPEDKPLIEVSFKGEKKRFTAEEISSMVLAKVKEIAEKFLKCEVGKAVITVPAYFNNAQRQGTKDAGMIAGFEVMKLLNEPTAAAIAYDLDKRSEKEETVLVYDLGGGTFDVSVLKIKKNDITVKAVAGDTHLGGQDFDNRLVNYIVQECKMKRSLDLYRDSKSLRRLKSRCERAKRELSFAFDSVVDVNDDHCISIGRAKFEHLNMDLFEKTIDIVDKCIHDAGMKKWDIHLVLMVGGSSRIPKVQNMLKDFFNNEEIVHEKVNPDEAVAIGAALHAAVLNGDYTHSFVRDVAPLSLGINVKGEIMSVLIPRNTPIPVTRSHSYCTSKDNQTEIRVDVYEGERASTLDNLYLNGFLFTDIPCALSGVEGLEIGMEIDTNGILNVTAEHKRMGKKETLRVTSQYGGLVESEIAEMIEEAQQLKLEDISWKEKAVLRNQLDDCIYYTDKLLQAKKLASEEERNSFQNLLSQTEKWLKESSTDKDKVDLEEKISEIRKLLSKLIAYPDKANQDSSKGASSIFSIFSGWRQSKE